MRLPLPIRNAIPTLWLCACASADVTAPAAEGKPPGTPADSSGGATGGTTYTYRFGAKFEPPIGRIVHGLGQWHDYNAKYSALLPATAQPASELSFIPIADTLRPWNPALIAANLAAIDARGRIPLVNLSMWADQPTAAQLAAMNDKTFGVDSAIAHGTKWDARLNDFVNVLRNYHKPVMLRIGGEFSGWWNGYHPYEYPKAFRKIAGMIRAAGADNVAFVWCYEPAAAADFDEKNAAGEWKWFPGDDVVDWFSVDVFQTTDFSGPTTAHGSLSAFGRTLKFLDMAVAHQRPVVIAESSPAAVDLAAAGTQAWNDWFMPYFAFIASRPEVEWFMYINYDWTKASYYQESGWKNNDLAASPPLAALYAAELAKPQYLHSAERMLLKDFAKYK
jgi:hypothetical protein